ncbi:MAG: hypothetical protein HN981_03045 [Candidatus Pacebacteria bacterium]|nr:hypothetical protein [Candidatus Paceibacterota bacterium]
MWQNLLKLPRPPPSMQSGLDIIGDIGIVNFHKRYFIFSKWLQARTILKQNKSLRTVVEKRGQVSGKLRTFNVRHLTGERNKTTIHKENNCLFYMDIEKTYFSARLSNERKIVSESVLKLAKKNSKILVMFSGVGPYPITIAKLLKKNSIKAEITSNELNTEANKFMKKNVALNKVSDYIKFVDGDANLLPKKIKDKFDIILMPRPNIDDTFLRAALKMSKKGTKIFYHGFGTKEKVLEEIRRDTKGKIGRISIRKAGDIAPFKFRWQVEFQVK